VSKKLAVADAVLSVALRRYLYLTAAVTGGAIMIIEILGAKMLAPYFGTSHFVWTAQIAVTLVALAAGYYAGGRLADASAKLGRLYVCILLAAVYVALSIALVQSVAFWCLQFRLPIGSLMASTFLFFVPLALLAITGPFLVRVVTLSVDKVGGNTGRLISIGTVGSVVGTILIGYVLVPLLPNSVTMFVTSALLLAIVVAYYLVWGRRTESGTAIAAGVVTALLIGWGGIRRESLARYNEAREIFRGNSNFGLLQVIENKRGNNRLYLNDFLTQNTYDPHTRQSLSLFTYMLHYLARAYAPRLDSALCIGLGVGIVPMQLALEGVKVDVIEINPAVVPVATRFFDFQPDKLGLHIGDGRAFLNQAAAQHYDAVVLDAFLGDSAPSHLMTSEAFRVMRRVLTPDGVLVINIFGDFAAKKGFLTASLDKTLKTVFANVRIHASGNGNVFFVASARSPLEIVHPPDLTQIHPTIRPSAESAFAGVKTTDPQLGLVLTDDYNPIEFHDAPNREAWRRSLALSMKTL